MIDDGDDDDDDDVDDDDKRRREGQREEEWTRGAVSSKRGANTTGWLGNKNQAKPIPAQPGPATPGHNETQTNTRSSDQYIDICIFKRVYACICAT